MFLCIGTTPAAQRVVVFRQFTLGAVNRATRTLDGPAGKSVNVAKVLQVLGADPVATGFLGGQRGRELRASLEARGVKCDFVTITTPTRLCVTVIDQSAETATELVEESRPAEPADYEKLLAVVERRIVVTAGAAPTLAFDGHEFWRVTAPKVKAVNPIGSGDTFTAGLAWRLTSGDALGEACRWATAAGAANTLTPMPGEVKREDVENLAPLVTVERI